MCTSKIIHVTVLLAFLAVVVPNAYAMQREEKIAVEPKPTDTVFRGESVNAAGTRIVYYSERLPNGAWNIINYFETGPEAGS
jgi:hypothetical protein